MASKSRKTFRSVTAWPVCVTAGVLLLACTGRHDAVAASPSPHPRGIVAPNGVRCTGFMLSKPGYSCYEKVNGRPGVRCSGYIAPGNDRAFPPPPVIYSVSDIGKPGASRLTLKQLRTVRQIERVFGRTHLQFVLLPELVVFNATRGVCADWAGGYPMLNGNPDGRRFYEPGNTPYTTGTAPG